VRGLLLPHLALLQEAGGYHQCVVQVRERIAPNAGSARALALLAYVVIPQAKKSGGGGGEEGRAPAINPSKTLPMPATALII
jgi:hypothetical protein